MLIEILNPITVDGKPFSETLQLNLNPLQRQLRCRVKFADPPPGGTLIDLNVYEYTLPKIDGFGFSVSFRGKELITRSVFEGYVSYKISKRVWSVSGKYGDRIIQTEGGNLLHVFNQVQMMLLGKSSSLVANLPINVSAPFQNKLF